MVESGAINYYSQRADEHVERIYESIRKRNTDCLNIDNNTGFSIEQVETIKSYLFIQRHHLSSGYHRFDSDFAIAESWRRLSERGGKSIKPHDVLLLKHELYEIVLLLQNIGLSGLEAHIIAEKKYNYSLESSRFYSI